MDESQKELITSEISNMINSTKTKNELMKAGKEVFCSNLKDLLKKGGPLHEYVQTLVAKIITSMPVENIKEAIEEAFKKNVEIYDVVKGKVVEGDENAKKNDGQVKGGKKFNKTKKNKKNTRRI
jgi:hypothetical protein